SNHELELIPASSKVRRHIEFVRRMPESPCASIIEIYFCCFTDRTINPSLESRCLLRRDRNGLSEVQVNSDTFRNKFGRYNDFLAIGRQPREKLQPFQLSPGT